MYIVMHCGGIPFNGDTIKTKSLGGSETAAYYMALELTKQGHHVTIFTESQETGLFDGVKYEWVGNRTEQAFLGERFMFYAQNNPHDVCIIQRHPRAFERRLASKINLWWLHDLALVRDKDLALAQMWNVDQVLCVSEFHKKQVMDTWGLEDKAITAITNGIDLELFKGEITFNPLEPKKKNLLYSSRPERGLMNLVGEGGLMEKLKDSDFHLNVCNYDNTTPETAEYYAYLYSRCDELPNVSMLGHLTKRELADVMRQCDAMIYPTTFEEVSCITAMECMAAGLPFIASEWAALPETCKDSGSILLPLIDGQVQDELFLKALHGIPSKPLKKQQLEAAKKYAWCNAASMVANVIAKVFENTGKNTVSMAHHFMRYSDIKAFEKLNIQPTSPLAEELLTEYELGYKFYRENTYAEHYKGYYQYEKDRGIEYGAEDVTGTSRFQVVANYVSALPSGSRVLDYGCAHGHYTVALARLNPTLTFVGADLAQSNVDTAREWAKSEGLDNVEFNKVSGVDDIADSFDLIIAAEVIEHVGNPQEYIDTLASHLTETGKMVITTPYGAWEAQGYRQHGYWRAHLHHFERQDIAEMVGHHPEYKITVAPSGSSQFSTPVGSYIYSFGKPVEPSRKIDYERKIRETAPDQTLTVCMIVKDGEKDLGRCLDSVLPHVQEVIIGVDKTTKDKTRELLEDIEIANPLVAFDIFEMDSPSQIGFAAARNQTLAKATGDWILWIDSDEVLSNGDSLAYYLRNNMYNGLALRQHHFSMDPMAVIKVDLPCRIFRNGLGIKFFGYVHEHPEIELNEGLGSVMLLPHAEIAHYGYKNENVRRGRFNRNINLLAKDRKENPERLLGKFLWIRDLAQMCQYDMEAGKADSRLFYKRAEEGIKLWEELLESGNTRITLDALPFYSQLVDITGQGFNFGFMVDANKMGEARPERAQRVEGRFKNEDHANRLMMAMAKDKTSGFESRYY